MIIRKFKSFFSHTVFITHSLKLSFKIKPQKVVRNNNHTIRMARQGEIIESFRLYCALHDGNKLSLVKQFLYLIAGRKLLVVALKAEGADGHKEKMVGVDMYYVNKMDAKQRTVHEGFVGVLPCSEGKGIATEMRNYAAVVFKESGVAGISTRVSHANSASLYSAKKVGFSPIESYYDEGMKEGRYYMIKKINGCSDLNKAEL